MNNFLQRYELVISTLSPVHMGCGEDYEPTNYVMVDDCLYPFHAISESVFPSKQQRDALLAQCNSIHGLWNIFHHPEHLETMKALAERYIPLKVGIQAQQIQRIKNNQFPLIIERTAFDNISGTPIFPGSGIKGAIRTAILEQQAREKKFPDAEKITGLKWEREKENKSTQVRLLEGSFASDPLRLLKFSDAHLADKTFPEPTRILTRHSRHRRDNTKTSVPDHGQNFAECIAPFMAGAFRAELSLLENRHVWKEKNKEFNVKNFTIGNILKACNGYYLGRLKEQMEMLCRVGTGNWFDRILPLVEQAIHEGRGFLLRTGKHAGADYLTTEKYRRIQTKYEKRPTAETLPISTTLCGDNKEFLPFGWVFVEVFEFGKPSPSPLQKGLSDLADEGAESDMKGRQERFMRERLVFQEIQTKLHTERLEQAAREAEAAAVAQAEAERRASLTQAGQEIEALRDKFTKMAEYDRPNKPNRENSPGGPMISLMRQIMTSALNPASGWSDAERCELAALCREQAKARLTLGGKEKEIKAQWRQLEGAL